MPKVHEQTRFEIANERGNIITLLRDADVSIGDFDYGTPKVTCPFCEELAMRVYVEDNACYCFSCMKRYGPVTFYAEWRGISVREATESVLELTGYRAASPESRWESLENPVFTFDQPHEAQALKMYCARVEPAWTTRQHDQQISALLTRCLNLLDRVASAPDLAKWRTATRSAMQNALSTTQGEPQHG